MTRRMAVGALAGIVVAATGAAPAAAQDSGAAGVPRELWEPPRPQAPAEGADGEFLPTALLTVLALGAAGAAGFLATGIRRPVAPRAPALPRPEAGARPARLQRCSIHLVRSSVTSQFRVVVGKGDERQVVGRSRRFPAPRSGPLPDAGEARAAFDELIGRLETVGWRVIADESAVWHRVRLVRLQSEHSDPPVERAVVDAFGDGFAAFTFDDYGNRLRLAERRVAVDESPEDAHAALLAQLESDGWEVAGDGEPWFATPLTRRPLALVT